MSVVPRVRLREGAAAVVLLFVGALGLSPVTGARAAAGAVVAAPARAAAPAGRALPELVSMSPPDGRPLASFRSPLVLRFGTALAADSALPTLSPATGGGWTRSGSTLTFVPGSQGWPSYATVTVHATGLRSITGAPLAPTTLKVTTGAPSLLRFQQLLAELGYLPLRFEPAVSVPTRSSAAVPAIAQPGTFQWRFADTPASLQAHWAVGRPNLITRGAIMAFEAMHNLGIDGVASKAVWVALHEAALAHRVDPRPYDYITVTEAEPERLSVWQDGKVAYTSLANTGMPGATTATGTYPVYLRYVTTTMVGTDPDGAHYDDAGIPWVAYFNGGDAIHGFVRASYGWPQSNGCVELPPSNAAAVWPMDYYGTLVTVT